MGTPTLSQYIIDLTNACNYLDEQVAANSTETFFNGTTDVYKVQALVAVSYTHLTLPTNVAV